MGESSPDTRRLKITFDVSVGNILSIITTAIAVVSITLTIGSDWQNSKDSLVALREQISAIREQVDGSLMEMKSALAGNSQRSESDIRDLRARIDGLDQRISRSLESRRGDADSPVPPNKPM